MIWHGFVKAFFMPFSPCSHGGIELFFGRGAAGIPNVAEDVAQPSVGAATSAVPQLASGPNSRTQCDGGS